MSAARFLSDDSDAVALSPADDLQNGASAFVKFACGDDKTHALPLATAEAQKAMQSIVGKGQEIESAWLIRAGQGLLVRRIARDRGVFADDVAVYSLRTWRARRPPR